MLHNCAETCKLCEEAKSRWKQTPEGQKYVDVEPYAALGVSASASSRDIKKAYRKISLKYHPDKTGGDADSTRRFKEAAAAFELVGDPDKRELYDAFAQRKFTGRWQYEQAVRRGDIRGAPRDGLYGKDNSVVTVNDNNAWPLLQQTKTPLLVKFYAPWCGHCQDGAPEFKKAAVLIDKEAKLLAVDCDRLQNVCNHHGINGFPTIMLLWKKRGVKQLYEGDHTAEGFFSFVALSLVSKVHKLTQANFEDKVIKSNPMWLVDFSAGRWCGPCMQMKDEITSVAREMHGIANIGIVNCDDNKDLCGEYNVQSYPHLKLFPRGPNKKQYESIEAHGRGFGAGLKLFNIVAKAALKWRECYDETKTREKLTAIYTKFNRRKVAEIDILLTKHRGNEDDLLKRVAAKYNISKAELEQIELTAGESDDEEDGDEAEGDQGDEDDGGADAAESKQKEEL